MLARFRELEEVGLVKIEADPEVDFHDDSYVDTWDLPEHEALKEKTAIQDRIELEGLWIYTAYFRLSVEDEWIPTDSMGNIIGSLEDLGYEYDLRKAVVEAYELEGKQERYK